MKLELKIVPPKPEFAEAFLKWRGEPHTVKYNPVKSLTLEELVSTLKKAPINLDPLLDRTTYRRFIEFKGKVVGTVSLAEVNLTMRYGEIGYTVAEDFKGKGIATAALKLWVAMLFEKTDLRKLIASVAEGNLASLRVLEKVGFIREGLLRDHYLIRGQPTSQVLCGLLRPDWASVEE